MDIQVLVAALHGDWSLPKKMNLQSPAIIANQCEQWSMEERDNVCMISTKTRGVGQNRNIALSMAQADILLFADDDMSYYDGVMEQVVEAFRQLPQADVLIFGMDMTKNDEVYEKRRLSIKRCHLHNSLKYGACRIAIRRKAIEKANLRFSQEFGGGCRYGSGEDTLFLYQCFKSGLQVWSHSLVLGRCAKDTSTWFHGYDEKYFFDKGALFTALSPTWAMLFSLRFLWRHRKKFGAISLNEEFKAMQKGRKDYLTRRSKG